MGFSELLFGVCVYMHTYVCVYVFDDSVYVFIYYHPVIYLENLFLVEYISVYVLADNLNTLIK